MTLETLIDDINAKGWRVNNLFQTHGKWRANLTNAMGEFHEFGHGLTALEAMTAALAAAQKHDETLDGLDGDLARLAVPTKAEDMFS